MTDLPILYHGTRAGFTGHGGLVLPGDHLDVDNHDMERSDKVYVTEDLEVAWMFAESCPGRGRARVCVVRPLGVLWPDESTIAGERHASYRCDAAIVETVLFHPPPEEAS